MTGRDAVMRPDDDPMMNRPITGLDTMLYVTLLLSLRELSPSIAYNKSMK